MKDNLAENLTPDNVPSFGSIEINWEPDETTAISETGDKEHISVYPNPGSGIYTIDGENIEAFEIRNSAVQLVLKSSGNTIDISDQPDGVYLLTVTTNSTKKTYRLIKN